MRGQVTVVVPAHAPTEDLRQCLAALAMCDPQPAKIILVLDGVGWRDGEPDFAQPTVQIHRMGRQAGPAAARNEGTALVETPWIAFVDSDVVVQKDFIAKVNEIVALDRAEVFFGSYDAAPRAPGLFSRYRNLLHHYTHQIGNENASTFWAGCGVIKRDVLRACGGFDAHFSEPSIEDVELGMRIRSQGHKIRLEKSLQVTHLKCWHVPDVWKTDVLKRALPWSRLLLREKQACTDLNLSASSRISGALSLCALLALVLSGAFPDLGFAALASFSFLFALNSSFYAVLSRTGGVSLLAAGMFFHYIYYLMSTATFAFCQVEAAVHGNRRSAASL